MRWCRTPVSRASKQTKSSASDDRAIAEAVAILRGGGVVGLPTETVYGLAGDAENVGAVRRIFAIKGRPANHPVIVHLASIDQLEAWSHAPSADALRLAERFWPGPLTLIVPRSERAGDFVTGGQSTVGLRVPSHPIAQRVLRAFGGGLAAPSANRFGAVSPTRAEHVRRDLGEAVDLVLDGGDSAVGLESTIVDCSRAAPTVLRPGAITNAMLVAVLGSISQNMPGVAPRVSGSLPSHYAPRARVEIYDDMHAATQAVERLRACGGRVATIGFDRPPPERMAVTLYAEFRDADESGCTTIVVVLPPPSGIGDAIRDRLARAAAPRSPES